GLKGVRASTIRIVRENLWRIDQHFRKNSVCIEFFMKILREPDGVASALSRMNSYGVLGAYVPAFGAVVGQMQHDLFHVYTVDAHSLFVVRNLRRFAVPDVENEFPIVAEIMSQVAKPERLYLAGFFHDIAKGRGGDHSKLGERDAVAFCKRHGMSEYDCHLVGWLVRHHLLMSWTAQRQDISDPEVVLQFAQTVGDQEHLDNLYLLTIADIRGTSPRVWNSWKGRLLTDLYTATTRVLRRGFGAPIHLSDRIRDLKRDALDQLSASGLPVPSIEKHWEMLDDEYFLRHDADSIAWHAHCIVAAPAIDLPLVAARHAGANQVLIYAPEFDELLSVVAGGFDRLGMNIVDARIHANRSRFALCVFVALNSEGEAITSAQSLHALEASLRQQILSPKAGSDPRRVNVSRTLKHFPINTQVSFVPSVNGQQTMMEVIAQDRPGLVYQVSLALLHCKVRLVTAKITTYGERAEDIFFITDRDGKPVTGKRQQACLRSRINRALGDVVDRRYSNGVTAKAAAF
ncbi:MAG: HD domain-containing protein, partial [Gammaproteobacteria bacterium]|nr:HD domain-containing protein [Gammaproteobacteria bacterium]